MLTKTELQQIKAALNMLNPDDCVRKVFPDVMELLGTFTEEEKKPTGPVYRSRAVDSADSETIGQG